MKPPGIDKTRFGEMNKPKSSCLQTIKTPESGWVGAGFLEGLRFNRKTLGYLAAKSAGLGLSNQIAHFSLRSKEISKQRGHNWFFRF